MKFGAQLYTFRTALAEDFKGTIKEIAKMGFDGVEFACYFGGMDPEETAAILKENGLETCGIMFNEQNLMDPGDIAWEYAKQLDPPAVSISIMTDFTKQWKEILERCLAIQKNAEEKGFLFSYHNHWDEYALADGIPAIYRILDAPGAEKIFVEPDVCWLTRGGVDPASYIRKYGSRIKQVHFKDIVVADDPETTTALGTGIVDLKSSWQAVKEIGCGWLIYEQDYSADPFQSAADSLTYMKTL